MLAQFLLKLHEAQALGKLLAESAQHAHVADQVTAAVKSIEIAVGLIHPIAPAPPVAPPDPMPPTPPGAIPATQPPLPAPSSAPTPKA